MQKRRLVILILVLVFLCLGASAFIYRVPAVRDRLVWQLEELRTRVKRALIPPEQVVFVPREQVDAIVQATLEAILPTETPTPPPTATATALPPGPTATPLPSPTPTPLPTQIPERVELSGVVHEYQQMNNCGPTTLAMALSFWGWQGDQRDTRAYLRPNFKEVDDKNVMPAEMQAFVEAETDLKALVRVGGDAALLKQFIAAGFPVVVEKGLQQHPRDWMGHYVLVTGYDDARQRFITQDSYIMADLPVPYAELEARWHDFNEVFLVIYPPDRESEVLSLLGDQEDERRNFEYAAQMAEQETAALSGRELYFAWYNLGTNLTALGDYPGAAAAYDQAFSLYPAIAEEDRPWRMLWYQTGPYEAYYQTGRYFDLLNLADKTLATLGKPILEETFYWAGMAREAQGEVDKAVVNYQKAVGINPFSTPAAAALQRLGVEAP